MKMKKLSALLLALTLIVGMLPLSAAAGSSSVDLKGCVDFTAGDDAAALELLNGGPGGTGSATWDSGTKTLSFPESLTYTLDMTADTASAAMRLPADTTISIADGKTVNIVCTGTGQNKVHALEAMGNLTLTGSGTFKVTAPDNVHTSIAAWFYCPNDADSGGAACNTLTVGTEGGDSPTVELTGGQATYESDGLNGWQTELVMNSGSLTAKSNGVTNYLGYIYSRGMAVKIITLNNGTLQGIGGTAGGQSIAESCGVVITACGHITMTYGSLTATGGQATSTSSSKNAQSIGLYNTGSCTISGGTVNASGGDVSSQNQTGIATTGSYGYLCQSNYGGDLTISDGTVNISAGNVNANTRYASSAGIDLVLSYNINITGGTVTATGGNVTADAADTTGTAYAQSFGVISLGVKVTGGSLAATAGTSAITNPISKDKTSLTSCGIRAGDGYNTNIVELKNCTVTATGKAITAGGTPPAVDVYSASSNGTLLLCPCEITNATVTATGNTNGLYCDYGELTISGTSNVTATATTPAGNTGSHLAAAIRAADLNMNGGTITAVGAAAVDDTDDKTFGLYCYSKTYSVHPTSVEIASSSVTTATLKATFSGGASSFKGGTVAVEAEGGIVTANGLKPFYAKETFKSGTTTELTQKEAATPVLIRTGLPLTVSRVTVTSKTYDGTKTAALNIGSATLSGVEGSDDVSLSNATATAEFNTKDVGTNKAVTITSGLTLTGADAEKYDLTQPTGLKGEITAATSVTLPTPTVTVIKGVGTFTDPVATGFTVGDKAETVAGTYTYTISGTDYTHADLVDYLKTQDVTTSSITVNYKFTSTDPNYNVTAQSSTMSVNVVDVKAFITGGTAATVDNALTVKASPVYGDSWADIVKIKSGIYAQIGDDNTKKDTTKSHFKLSVTGKPNAGDDKAYSILYSGTINGTTFTNVPVITGTVNVAQKPITVKPKDVRVYVNASAPTLGLDYGKVVSGDTVTASDATFEIKDGEGNYLQKEVDDEAGNTTMENITDLDEALAAAVAKTGTYQIIWDEYNSATFTGADNYAVTAQQTGTLTVSSRPTSTPPAEEPEECDGGDNCVSRELADVDTTEWYHKAVDYAIENKLMSGVGDGKFDPNGNLTRAMLCQIFYNKEGRPAVTAENTFADVKTGAWYEKAVTWAASNKIVMGYDNGNFGPTDDITREQLAAIIWRYDGKKVSAASLDTFNDAGKISSYAVDALKWAYENGVVSGKGNGILDPIGKATRAEVAQMLMNYLEK